MLKPDKKANAFNAFMAANNAADARQIGGIAARVEQLIRRLRKFYFPLVAQPLAGLLTRPENHAATGRIEALIHLAALACRGTQAPTLAQLREWLNKIIFRDPLTQLEDPVEDVFVSNVATWFGNARLFDGGWPENDYYVQICLKALTLLRERPWSTDALTHVVALLRLGEAAAARAGVPRFTLSEVQPRQSIKVTTPAVEACRTNVTFTVEEIFALGFSPGDLNPFVFHSEHADSLAKETLGHTTLERRPLVRTGGLTILVLPTAIGAAIRRYIIERAAQAGDLGLLQSTIAETQFGEMYHLGRVAWDIDPIEDPHPGDTAGIIDFIGKFDEGAYVHAVFVPDDLSATAQEGLQGVHSLSGVIDKRIEERTAEIAARPGYRRGLTLLVHGGVGRGFSAGFGEPPPYWQRLGLPLPDFMRLGWDTELSVLRAWKLLDQEDALAERDVIISNINGFPNLYAYARNQDFELVPEAMTLGFITLATDFLTPLRHQLRVALDQHVALAPDKNSWVEVQRETTSVFFAEAENLPTFISPAHLAQGKLLGCVETNSRPWWIECDDHPRDEQHRSIVFQVYEMSRNWLILVAPMLEQHLPELPAGPISFRLQFPDIAAFDQSTAFSSDPPTVPTIEIRQDRVLIGCSTNYLRAFASAVNVGDRLMVAALIRGASALAGIGLNQTKTDTLVNQLVPAGDARFFHTIPAHTPHEMVYAGIPLPRPRLQTQEDRAWSRLGLAQEAGWTEAAGPIPEAEAGEVLHRAVDAIWERVRARLITLDRTSVVERSLLNRDAVERDRETWRITAAALLALYRDTADVLRVAYEREIQRALAGLASRVIAEMALSTCPLAGGAACTGVDLDYLIAQVGTLLDCAGQSDAMRYGLVSHAPVVNANGSFGFDVSFGQTSQQPYMTAHSDRQFRGAAADYGSAFQIGTGGETGAVNSGFDAAFVAEFGISLVQYFEFVLQCTMEALEKRRSHFRLSRDEVLTKLQDAGVPDPSRTLGSLALTPRARWDEEKPRNAKPRDWYPWRYNRRLSVLRRPLIQLSNEANADMLIVPTLLDTNLRYLCQAASGRLPIDLFDTKAMRGWIGGAVDRDGHEFNHTVATRLEELGWRTRLELRLTTIGGGAELGDIDVLVWRSDRSVVYVVECKRLLFARTIGEIGERLAEYTSVTESGDRTPIQKHRDRMDFLRGNPTGLASLTMIPVDQLQIRSALVTDYLVPMQFSARARSFVDLVTDLALLAEAFG